MRPEVNTYDVSRLNSFRALFCIDCRLLFEHLDLIIFSYYSYREGGGL